MTDAARNRRLVLFEAHNLSLRAGTGIATYARQLNTAVQSLGHQTGAILSTDRALAQRSALIEQVFTPHRRRSGIDPIRAALAGAMPLSARALKVPHEQMTSDAAPAGFPSFREVHVLAQMVEKETAHFQCYGRRLTLRIDSAPDLFHATRPAPLHVPGCPNVYTLHDIVPLRLPYTTLDDKKTYLSVIQNLCRTADHIITVSEFSRRDIIELTGIAEHRITNTYQSISLPADLLEQDDARVNRDLLESFGVERDSYFLFLGALEPKKNVCRLIEAYAASRVSRPLFIAGGEGWMNKEAIDAINSDRFLRYRIDGGRLRPERRVLRWPYLPLEQLVTLVRGARAMLFPSIYEGFGLPIVEAMLLGTPVMTSNVSSLPEVAGDAALTVDPYNVEAMANAIRVLDADDDLRRDLVTRGLRRAQDFRPARHAERLADIYRQVL